MKFLVFIKELEFPPRENTVNKFMAVIVSKQSSIQKLLNVIPIVWLTVTFDCNQST